MLRRRPSTGCPPDACPTLAWVPPKPTNGRESASRSHHFVELGNDAGSAGYCLGVLVRTLSLCIGTVGLLTGCANSTAPQYDPAADRAAIETALRQWPDDFNDRKLPAVCGLFADDVVLAYPDGGDRDRGQFCDRMKTLFDDPAKSFSYAEPDIKEVLVAGDLATVKLFWTLTVADKSGKVLDTMVEDGLDVFQRQADGSWKIHISHAFTA
jgi:ketosteroid isomerase-like protein